MKYIIILKLSVKKIKRKAFIIVKIVDYILKKS